MPTPIMPIRLQEYAANGSYYPRQLLEADGKLYIVYNDGSIVHVNKTVELVDAINSTDTTKAATPNSVKMAYDLASAALPKTGGTVSGNIEITATPNIDSHVVNKKYVDDAITDLENSMINEILVNGETATITNGSVSITIPDAPVQSVSVNGSNIEPDNSGKIDITSVPASIVSGLSKVAKSNAYSDLDGTPTIPEASTSAAVANGTASPGSSNNYARADHVHPSQISVSGNAGTATKLATSRTIGISGVTATGASFDGSEDVNISITAVPASIVTDLSAVATSGKYSDLSDLPIIYGPSSTTPNAAGTAAVGTGTTFARADHVHPAQTSVSGNAGTATKLANAVNITLSGGATGTGSFDGSGDTNISVSSLDGSKITGTIPLASIPKGAQERLIVVANDTARLSLSSSQAQNGDVVKVESTGIMYYIVDDTSMGSEDAFSVFTAGAASSVDWTGITNKPSEFTPISHNHSASEINSGTLGVVRGGTGNTTFASGAVLIGNGTDAIQTRSIDTTSGGTSDSSSLITSGAVYAGLDGKAPVSHGTHVTYGTSTPAANGTASTGSADSVSRSDHVHPLQTSVPGNAGTATKATQDSEGQNIASTYIKDLSVNGTTITYTKGDGTTGTITTQDTNTIYTLSSFGITASATELNYVSGVTSAIQTQLNNINNTATAAQTTANNAMPKSGGTFTGAAYAKANTSYTTYQLRNIALSTSAAVPTGNGSILGVYS